MPHKNNRRFEEGGETTKPERKRREKPLKPSGVNPGSERRPQGARREAMDKRDWDEDLDNQDEDFEEELDLDDEDEDEFLDEDEDEDEFLDEDEDD
jgi:DNA-directed RNA polymerase subunit delta